MAPAFLDHDALQRWHGLPRRGDTNAERALGPCAPRTEASRSPVAVLGTAHALASGERPCLALRLAQPDAWPAFRVRVYQDASSLLQRPPPFHRCTMKLQNEARLPV